MRRVEVHGAPFESTSVISAKLMIMEEPGTPDIVDQLSRVSLLLHIPTYLSSYILLSYISSDWSGVLGKELLSL